MSDALIAMIAAVAGGLVALWTFERQARLSHVTAERAAWRSRIRSVAADLLVGTAGGTTDGRKERDEDARMRAAVTLQLSTNPYDPLDREIVELAFRIADAQPGDEADRRLFALRVQLLLKHDWERAKIEAGWRNPVTKIWKRCTGKKEGPARPSYDRFVDWRMRHSVEIDRRLPPP